MAERYKAIYAFFDRNKRRDSMLDWYFRGIDGLAMIIGDKYKQNPFEKGTLLLF